MRVAEIGGGDVVDAGRLDVCGRHTAAGELANQNRQLLDGIDAADVLRRVGLGETATLRLDERRVVLGCSAVHLRQDEVGRAVDDAGQGREGGGIRPSRERAEEWHAGDDAGFVAQGDAGARGRVLQLVAVMCHERLVRGDDGEAAADGLEDQGACRLDAA